MLGIPLLAVLVKVGLKVIWSCWCPETSGTPTTASGLYSPMGHHIKLMNKKRLKAQAGDLIKMPFKKDWHTYARILVDGSYAIYDCPSTTERADFEEIIKSDILFIARVDIFGIKDGSWDIVTNIPLEENLKKFYPRYFNPAPQNSENVGFYKAYKEDIERAIDLDWIRTGKMQLDGIHGRVHIEDRINDYYEGRKNDGNKANIWFFKKYLGLTEEDHP